MSVGATVPSPRSVFRHSRRDALLVGLAFAQGAVLAMRPPAPIVALGMWWCANTVAHHFIHAPFFRQRWLNRAMSLYLSLLLGVPQTVWRDRHLAHHAGVAWHFRLTRRLRVETLLVLAVWERVLATDRAYFVTQYLPGLAAGLLLCWIHGHYEHTPTTTSHYGWIYNMLFFNDGYHVEHHARSGTHWTQLPRRALPDAPRSRWPAVIRWLDACSLDALERLVFRSATLRKFVLERHDRALRSLLAELPEPERVAIVGGGLFPRTAILLARLLPHSRITAIEANPEHIRLARPLAPREVDFVCDWYDADRHDDFDLVVIPLGFIGDRERHYRQPPARHVLIHDWIWRRRGRSVVVSWFLLKRVNLVENPSDEFNAAPRVERSAHAGFIRVD